MAGTLFGVSIFGQVACLLVETFKFVSEGIRRVIIEVLSPKEWHDINSCQNYLP
jgi:hypothetical protein